MNIHWKDWCWSWNSNILATWCKEPTHWKDPDVGKDWKQKEKRVTEDEMVGWHHQFIGHELGQTPRDGERQGALVCCSPWSYKELDMAWQLNTHTHARTHTHTQIYKPINITWMIFSVHALCWIFIPRDKALLNLITKQIKFGQDKVVDFWSVVLHLHENRDEDPTLQIALVWLPMTRIFQRVVPGDTLAEGEMWPSSPVQVDSRLREGFQLALKDYLVQYTNPVTRFSDHLAKGTFQRQTPLICVAEINNNLFLPKLQTHQKTKGWD